MTSELRTNLNLLPPGYRRRVLIRTGLMVWAGVWTAGLLVGSLALWNADRGSASVRDELSRYQRRYAPTEIMAQEVDAMRRRLVEVRAEEQAVANLEDDRPLLSLLGIISQAAQACGERLQVRKCTLQRPTKGPPSSGPQRLTIQGAALDLPSVTRFHAVLRDAGMFDRVERKPTRSEQIGGASGYVYQVECVYQ